MAETENTTTTTSAITSSQPAPPKGPTEAELKAQQEAKHAEAMAQEYEFIPEYTLSHHAGDIITGQEIVDLGYKPDDWVKLEIVKVHKPEKEAKEKEVAVVGGVQDASPIVVAPKKTDDDDAGGK